MLKQEKIDDFFREFARVLPDDIRTMRADMEKNLRAALSAAFARMDLVTREEFDVQSALLGNTRRLLDELEKRLDELEQQQKRGGG